MKKNIGLYFGTFNPIHVGHLIVANFMANYTQLDEVWLIVSPQNPHKQKSNLLKDYHRLDIVRVALEDNDKIKVSDIEFHLEKPSYTTFTLAHLIDKFPNCNFSLIMGEDNLRTLHKWKNSESILQNHTIYVYPRLLTEQELEQESEGKDNNLKNHPNVHFVDAPLMKISASFIRNAIKNGQDVKYLLTERVHKYIDEMHFYKN